MFVPFLPPPPSPIRLSISIPQFRLSSVARDLHMGCESSAPLAATPTTRRHPRHPLQPRHALHALSGCPQTTPSSGASGGEEMLAMAGDDNVKTV